MAFLPTIPTSFVPKESQSTHVHHYTDFVGAFGFLAYMVLSITFVISFGVFFYNRVLASTEATRQASLQKAEASIDMSTIKEFTRLKNRLNSSQILLKSHTALSNFLALFGTLLPANVRFTSLSISIDGTGAAKVVGSGSAKSFNSLSVASSALSADNRIKDVIFSKISVTKDNTISFGFSATLDPKLVTYSAGGQASDQQDSSFIDPNLP